MVDKLERSIKIHDLPAPVTAAKADWLPGTTWLGFTPAEDTPGSRGQCMSAINHQFGKGWVLEYNTLKFGDVNTGFENDPKYLAEKQAHKINAGRLLAIHRLRPTGRSLREILGMAEFNDLQDRWAADGHRYRWSVAFPIIESYEIVGRPLANEVFDGEAMQRLFAHPSRTLRPLIDRERGFLSNLELLRRDAPNAWIAIEDETAIALRPENSFPKSLERNIGIDIASAIEGMQEERRAKVKRRAIWLANRFLRERTAQSNLRCDRCPFDPVERVAESGVSPRSLMDVHHKDPIAEGARYTTISDFELLCPNCHRFVHAVLRKELQRKKSTQ